MLNFRQDPGRRQMERLIQRGVGLHEHTWAAPPADTDMTSLATPIIEWLRAEVGRMRRPYGIDQVAVALACRDGHGRVLCSNSLGVVRPSLFYSDEGAERLQAFFDDAAAVETRGRKDIVVALLSLGDVAYELQAA